MNKDYAAQLLITASQVEMDPELALAMIMGARELSQDGLKWVPVDLRQWLTLGGDNGQEILFGL